ncbi:MAG: hypothetical protein FJX02_02945 [Alphaproteobacteria bacterium]|nr:hypothetical protein [Alphaproteobacteria bacterium]
MRAAILGGAAYGAAMFLLGFAVGTVRVLALAPALGEEAALAVELPAMVLAAWVLCGWSIRRWAVRPALKLRILMGLTAFCALMVAEFGLAVVGFGRDPTDELRRVLSWPGALGVLAQIACAAFPLLRGR